MSTARHAGYQRASQHRGAFCRQHFFRASFVSQQPAARELKEIEPELRVLEIERAHFVIRQRQHMAALDAFDGLRPLIARRQQSQLPENLARRKLVVHLEHPVLAFADQEHFVGGIAFAKENVTLPVFSFFHVGPQPIHRQIAPCRGASLLDQLHHLIKADRVHRQQQHIEHDRRERACQYRCPQQEDGAHQARDAQRNRGLHRHRYDVEYCSRNAQSVRP